MNKGQAGPLAFILMFIILIILFAVWLAPTFSFWGAQAVDVHGVDGVEGFLLYYFPLIFVLIAIVGIAWFFLSAGGNQ